MHELSIAIALVDAATEAADRAGDPGSIGAVSVRIGDLSGVVVEALEFAWPVATEGTRCAGAELCVERVPGRVLCPACRVETELSDPPRFRCGSCGGPTGDVRAGRELELVSLELTDESSPAVTPKEEHRHAAAHP